MNVLHPALIVAALVCFILAAANASIRSVTPLHLIALGLALWMANALI